MRKSGREAISPLIATIIIVAVTIAISLAVAAWLTGLWTVFTGGPRVSATLVNITVVDTSTGGVTAYVYLSNQGSASDTLAAATLINGTKTYPGSFSPTPIGPGTSTTIPIDFTVSDGAGTLVGREVSVELHFTSGTKITLVGIARMKPSP